MSKKNFFSKYKFAIDAGDKILRPFVIGLRFLVVLILIIVDKAYAYMDIFPAAFASACCLVYVFFFVIWIVIVIWVYRDAEQRGENGVLWLLIVLVAGIIGLIIWLILRPPIGGRKELHAAGAGSSNERRCPNCGRNIPFDSRICPYCGKKFDDFF